VHHTLNLEPKMVEVDMIQPNQILSPDYVVTHDNDDTITEEPANEESSIERSDYALYQP